MKTTSLTVLAAAITALNTQAALVLTDTFTYTNGPITTVSGGLWLNHAGTANQLDVLAGRAHLTAAESEDVNRPMGSFTSGTLYLSFLLNVSTLPTANGNYVAHLKDQTATGARARVFVTTSGAGAGRYRVGVANGAAAPSAIL